MIHPGKKHWYLTWIAFLVLVLTVTTWVLRPLFPGLEERWLYLWLILGWIIVLGCSVYLFDMASR